MKRLLQLLPVALLLASMSGCCIMARRIADNEDVHVLQSGYYHTYTNGTFHGEPPWQYANSIHRACSYTGGPWAGSDIYPATRLVLNHASFMSYSSAASGDYMINIINLPCYPIILVEIPIQFCLDTVLLPFDLLNRPTTPEGWTKIR